MWFYIVLDRAAARCGITSLKIVRPGLAFWRAISDLLVGCQRNFVKLRA